MTRPYRFLDVERRDDVFCTRLRKTQLDELMIHDLGGEFHRLVIDDGCRKLALSLGPDAPECLYSVFLAKLITLQRELREHQGALLLCYASPSVREIFAACALDQLFEFVPDFDAAVMHFAQA